MKTVHMTFVTEETSRGWGDWLSSKSTSNDVAIREFYHGPLPVSLDELPDLFTAAIENDVIISIEP